MTKNLYLTLILGIFLLGVVSACVCGDNICEAPEENSTNCGQDCLSECVGADYVFNEYMNVAGENCVPSDYSEGYQSTDSVSIEVEEGKYRVEVKSVRGNSADGQDDESFFFNIGGVNTPISEDEDDDLNKPTKWDDFGEYNFLEGSNVINMISAAPSCTSYNGPLSEKNSVEVTKICLYKVDEPECGNNIVEDGEECDDGNNVNGDGCSSCNIDVQSCGNGKLEFGEECDKGVFNGFLCWAGYGSSCTYCSAKCEIKTITNYCGDGIRQECEQCDDSNNVSGDGCSSKCKTENPQPVCGNDIVEVGEECDDGNNVNGDGCSSCNIDSCDNNVGVRYSYGNSFGTGIAIKPEGLGWINSNQPVNLLERNHEIRFTIDNLLEEAENVHIKVKIDNSIITEYDKEINKEHTNSTYLNTTGMCGLHTISLEVTSEGECNVSDNSASRQVYVTCENTQPVCGNGVVEEGEECDGQSYCQSDCTEEDNDDYVSLSYHGDIIEFNECVPKWECSGWSECSNGFMTRSCEDVRSCEYQYNKPLESSACIIEQVNVQEESNLKLWFLIGGAVLLIILLLVLLSLLRQ